MKTKQERDTATPSPLTRATTKPVTSLTAATLVPCPNTLHEGKTDFLQIYIETCHSLH